MADFGEMFEQVQDLEQNFGEGRIAGRFDLEHRWFSKVTLSQLSYVSILQKILLFQDVKIIFFQIHATIACKVLLKGPEHKVGQLCAL